MTSVIGDVENNPDLVLQSHSSQCSRLSSLEAKDLLDLMYAHSYVT